MIEKVTDKRDLLAAIEQSWADLQQALAGLNETQLTVLRDAAGWAGKDHLVHLTIWMRSVVFLLQKKPRHQGLGVAEGIYLYGDFDEINAVIYEQHKERPLADVMAFFRSVFGQLMIVLQTVTDADLQQRYRHYLPDEPGDNGDRLIIDVLFANTAHHFAEHQAWIESLGQET